MKTIKDINKYSLSVWIRQGEIFLDSKSLPAFNKKKLKLVAKQIPSFGGAESFKFCDYVTEKLESCGVALKHIDTMPDINVLFLTRFYHNKPIIQFSDEALLKSNFSFLIKHCIGHLVLHGKKRMFFETDFEERTDQLSEDEANKFARKLIPAVT